MQYLYSDMPVYISGCSASWTDFRRNHNGGHQTSFNTEAEIRINRKPHRCQT